MGDLIPHGTLTGAKRCKCKCDECREINNAYSQEHKRRRRAGRPTTNLVDAEPVRAHLQALLEAGVTRAMIVERATVTHGWIRGVVSPRPDRPPSQRVNGDFARRVLALPVPEVVLATGVQVCGDGPRRRAWALMAIGYPSRWQAAKLGTNPDEYEAFLFGEGRVVARRARAIRALYEQFWDRPAPETEESRVAVLTAEFRGYPKPLEWDDDLIDLPVEELAVEVDRRVGLMDPAEVSRCHRAVREGARGPVMVAASLEYKRVQAAARRKTKVAA